MDKTPNIVVIGGGTGSFTLLQALKKLTPNITALVSMADDGGSTGVLRDELGVLPPGDIRQCLVALSEAPEELRELFNFRFPADSSFAGHSFGNLFLSAVERMSGNDIDDAIRLAGDVLRIRGRVVPVTLTNCQLVMEHDGKTVIGEHAVELTKLAPHSRPKISLLPKPTLHPKAATAIRQADLIVIAPGNLYNSLAPALVVPGMADAIIQSKAHVAYVCNLVNKPNHTANFSVQEHAQEIERFTKPGVLDTVLYNIDEPSPSLLKRYALEGELPVPFDATFGPVAFAMLPGNFLSHRAERQSKDDILTERSLIRHDAQATATALASLV